MSSNEIFDWFEDMFLPHRNAEIQKNIYPIANQKAEPPRSVGMGVMGGFSPT